MCRGPTIPGLHADARQGRGALIAQGATPLTRRRAFEGWDEEARRRERATRNRMAGHTRKEITAQRSILTLHSIPHTSVDIAVVMVAVTRGRRAARARWQVGVLACLALAAACLLPLGAHALGVVAFDYGTDSLKTALIKPGMPPDVVLTRDSKRKLPSVVAWKGEDRSYGTDALNLATRFPGDTFPDLKLLLGQPASDADSIKQRYEDVLNATLVATDRNTFAATRATDFTLNKAGPDTHTVEELVGMQLSHAKMLAEETADEKVRITYPGTIGTFGGLDTVITVPTFWTAPERQALYDAATLAGFRPRIVSDAAAAATSFALARSFPKPELHLLYDSGHGSTRASLVRFSTRSFPTEDLFGTTSMKEHTFIEVLSTGWAREAGGLAFDELLRDILVTKFSQTSKEDIRTNPRAMAKLLLAASKAKHVLSANSDARVSIEGLINDVDFRTSVTRDEFEAAVAVKGLQTRFGSVVGEALEAAGGNVKLSDLQSVILLGGNSRVPLVQKALASARVDSSLLAQNLNADESMVLGAGFYGASFNPQLKMKPMRVADVNPYPVALRESRSGAVEEALWNGSPETLEEDAKIKHYEGQVDDFSFEVVYPTLSGLGYRVEVEDIDKTLRSLKSAGELSKVETSVNVTIASRPQGVVGVESAWLTVKPKGQGAGGVVGALRGFFGGSASSSASTNSNATGNGADGNATAQNGTASGGDTEEDNAADTLHDKHVRLTVRVTPLSTSAVQALPAEQQTKSKDKLYLMDAAARRKLQREEYRNRLESYVYRMRELVSSGGGGAFEQSSKPEERTAIESASGEATEWLSSSAGDGASVEALRARLNKLESLVKPIEARMAESRGRKGAASRLTRALESTTKFLAEANANLTAAVAEGSSSRYSRTDLDSLTSQHKADADWFAKVESLQSKKKQDVEPAWKVDEADKRAKKILERVNKLKKRRIPKTRPVAAAAAAGNSNKKGSSSSSSSGGGGSGSSSAGKEKETVVPPQKHEEL